MPSVICLDARPICRDRRLPSAPPSSPHRQFVKKTVRFFFFCFCFAFVWRAAHVCLPCCSDRFYAMASTAGAQTGAMWPNVAARLVGHFGGLCHLAALSLSFSFVFCWFSVARDVGCQQQQNSIDSSDLCLFATPGRSALRMQSAGVATRSDAGTITQRTNRKCGHDSAQSDIAVHI